MKRELPEGLAKYKETPEFTGATVPAGLLREHNTAAGVWGRLVILEGALSFTWSDGETQKVTDVMIIPPEKKHHIKCAEPVRFKVEFWR
ncbi:MAG: DUF1971 domain-containing protein [Pseudomonadota bacterium]